MSTHLARRAGRMVGWGRRTLGRWPVVVVPAAVAAAAVAVLLGPDLFMAIPWRFRKAAGMTAFVGLVGMGVARILAVRPGDRWPSPEEERPALGRVDRLLPWLPAAGTASLAWPMLAGDGFGHGDWDFYLQTYEAVRISILEYGQFPWWNPWARGGFPLAADPQCSLVPLATPLVLLLGTGPGLRVAVVICLMIAVEGARRLARTWIGDPWGSCAAGIVFGLHGGIIVYATAGLYVPMTFCAMPWMILATCRLADRPIEGVKLGAWSAFNVLGVVSYPTIYAFLIAGAFALRGLRVERGERRLRFLRHGVLAVGVMLALSGWRIGPMAGVLGEFPRTGGMLIDLRLAAFVEQMLVRPAVDDLETVDLPLFWESNCHLGVIGVALLVVSLAGNWRWWHWLALVAFWLGMGAIRVTHPSFWLSSWPVFSAMHVVTRWRIAAMLGVGLAVGEGVARLRTLGRPRWLSSPVAAALVIAMGADLVAFGHRALPVALGKGPTEGDSPGPPIGRIINLERQPAFPNTLRGYGTIRAIQPILGYDTGRTTARRWPGHPDYVGEFSAGGRPIEPETWSPNRIVLRVDPDQEIEINQNPGSWWLVNGRRAFPGWRCVEWERPFVARADGEGLVELRIAPVGLDRGILIQAIGILLIVGSHASRPRYYHRTVDASRTDGSAGARPSSSETGLP